MNSLRNWATPLTIGSSLVMVVTGILMFFHLETSLGKGIHEWAGWAMLAGITAHLVLNWRPFTLYFRRRLAVGIVAAGVVLASLSMVPLGNSGGGNPMMALADAAQSTQAQVLVQMAGYDWDEGSAKLAEQGITIAPDQSLNDVLGKDREAVFAALNALFAG